MSEIEITFDQAVDGAAKVVAELRDFLRDSHSEMTAATITLNGGGASLEMPSGDPKTAARIHHVMQACDSFINTARTALQ